MLASATKTKPISHSLTPTESLSPSDLYEELILSVHLLNKPTIEQLYRLHEDQFSGDQSASGKPRPVHTHFRDLPARSDTHVACTTTGASHSTRGVNANFDTLRSSSTDRPKNPAIIVRFDGLNRPSLLETPALSLNFDDFCSPISRRPTRSRMWLP